MASRYREISLRKIEKIEQSLILVERGMRNHSISADATYNEITKVIEHVEGLKGLIESEPDIYEGI